VAHYEKQLSYTLTLIGAVVNLRSRITFRPGKRSLIRFKEKDGKEKEIPVHPAPRIIWRTEELWRLHSGCRPSDSRTTKLYDRGGQKVLLEDMERIRY
jgi:hypothetical protein